MFDKFPVGFWNYTSIEDTDISFVKDWVECGITLTQSPRYNAKRDTDGSMKKKMLEIMDECHKNGIKLIINDSRVGWRGAHDNPEDYRRRYAEVLADFGNHPATYGIEVGDEPFRNSMPDVFAACKIQKEMAPHLAPFLNLLPLWNGGYIGYTDIDECFEDYKANLNVNVICYDRYSQMNPEDSGTDYYFFDLRRYFELAKEMNIPLWTTLLSVGHFRYRVPSYDDYRWQFNTAIASGCKGVMWFYFYGFNAPNSNYRGSPMNMFGERTASYYALSDVLREFHHTFGNIFETLELQKSYHLGRAWGGFPLFKDGDSDILIHAETIHGIDGIISFFKDEEGADYIAIVNNSKDKSGQLALKFPKSCGKLMRVGKNMLARYVLDDWHDEGLDDYGETYQYYPWLAPGQLNLYKIDK